MLASVRTAAVVAVLALATSLVALQVGSPAERALPGAAEPAGNWVTVTGEQAVDSFGYRSALATNTMSDERVSGDVAIWFKVADGPDNDGGNYATWGTVTITNDGGTWQGQWLGFVDDQGRHRITEWYEGTGDYDGLRYLEQLVQPEPNGVLEAAGLIYEGPIPQTVIPADVAA